MIDFLLGVFFVFAAALAGAIHYQFLEDKSCKNWEAVFGPIILVVFLPFILISVGVGILLDWLFDHV